jgi:hypothetical protein
MKNVIIALVLVAILGVGGYLYMNSKGMVPKVPSAMIGDNADKAGGVFTSIKDALSKSISLKCIFKDEQGVETTSYIKNGAVRVTMASTADPKQPDNIIMKDKKMHMWNMASKEGIVLEFKEPENVTPLPTAPQGEDAPATGDQGQQESILATIEKYKDACKPEVVADSMFTIPTDVKFQDMSALQREMMKGLEQQTPPQGAGGQEDYQKYLEQMMKQQGAQQ